MEFQTVLLLLGALSTFHGTPTVSCLDQELCHRCEGMEMEDDVCRCDEDCALYGDCCGSVMEGARDHDRPKDFPVFQCRSIFMNGSRPQGDGVEKAFWMVESCLPEWNGTQTEQDCRNSFNFYPVTDMSTGVVYSNGQCAACNSISGDTLEHWRYGLTCSDDLLNLIQQSDFNFTLDVLKANCQSCSYVEPDLHAPPPRPCYINTASCLSKDSVTFQNTTGKQYSALVKNCTEGPYSLVKTNTPNVVLYRNQYCALCNGINVNSMECASNENKIDACTYTPATPPTSTPTRNPTPPRDGPGGIPQDTRPDREDDVPEEEGSLNLVLDIFGHGVLVMDSEVVTTIVIVFCAEGQVFDPVLGECRQIVCLTCRLPPNSTYCLDGLVALNVSDFEWANNDTILFNGRAYGVLNTDPVGRPVVCLDIPSCLSYIALTEEDEYEYTENNTINYNDVKYQIVFYDIHGQPVICTNFSINGTREVNNTVLTYSYPGGFIELTYIGCSLSVLGCALILLTYSLFKELRTLPSKILMNLAAAILVSNLFLLLSDLGGDSQDFCIATAIILHLFFLAQFSWMSIMTFEMGRTFNNIRKLTPKCKKINDHKHFLICGFIGWGVPTIIVGASVAVNFTTDNLVLYGRMDSGEEGSCWLNHAESALVAFVAPVALSLLFNCLVLAFVTFWLCWARKTQIKIKKQSFPYIRVYFAIISITGLTWIFGFLAILAGTSWSWYPFIILNSFQGFTIFVLFLLTRKVLNRYLACLTCGKVGVSAPATKTVIVKMNVHPRQQWKRSDSAASNAQVISGEQDNEHSTNYELSEI